MSTRTTAATPATSMALTDTDPRRLPPLALYQSPWTISLAIAFLFQGAGTYVIDDVDNAGVERGQEDNPTFRVVRKEIMSKKGWTNARPLSAFCPDGLLFPNLARASYTDLDRRLPLATLARRRATNVPNLIRSSSRAYGMWTLAGPDKAITAVTMDEAAPALHDIIIRHEQALCRTLPREQDRERALKRLRHLMPVPENSSTLLEYFQLALAKGLSLVGSDAPVLSAARDLLPRDGGRLLPLFQQGHKTTLNAYNQAAAVQGSRLIDEQHPLPYYSVNLTTGERRDLTGPPTLTPELVIAPKILAMEGVGPMALPLSTAGRPTILAREQAYRGLKSGSSQAFFESNWLHALSTCTTTVRVHELFQPLVSHQKQMPVGDLVNELYAQDQSDSGNLEPEHQWSLWALRETLHDIHTWHYPLLTYAIGGEEWMSNLVLHQYATFTGYDPMS